MDCGHKWHYVESCRGGSRQSPPPIHQRGEVAARHFCALEGDGVQQGAVEVDAGEIFVPEGAMS